MKHTTNNNIFVDENTPNLMSPTSVSALPMTPKFYGVSKSPDEKLQDRGLPFSGDLSKHADIDASPLRSAAALFNDPSLDSVDRLINVPIALNAKVKNLSRHILALLSNNFKYQRRSPQKSINSTSIDTFFSEMLNGATKVDLNGEEMDFWHLQCVFIDTLVPLYRLKKEFDERNCVIKDSALNEEDEKVLAFCESALLLSSEFMKQIWGMLNDAQRKVVLSRVDQKVKCDLSGLSPLRSSSQKRSDCREVLRSILHENKTPARPSSVGAKSLDDALANAPKRGVSNLRYISQMDVINSNISHKVRRHRVSAFPDIFPVMHSIKENKQFSGSFSIA